jgi:hypothetical protein
MDVSGCVSEDYRKMVHEVAVTEKAAARLGLPKPGHKRRVVMETIKKNKLEGDLGRAGMMFMRSQLTGISLYLVTTEAPMTFEELENVLRYQQQVGTLRSFLARARV